MTQAELRSLLRMYVDDVNSERFTDEHCRLALNQGIRETYNRLLTFGVYTARATVDLAFSGSAQEVALPMTFYKPIVAFESVSKQRIIIVNEAKALDNETEDLFYIYFNVARYLRFNKVPINSFTITMRYSIIPDVYVNTGDLHDAQVIPYENHGIIAYRAAVDLLVQDEQNIQGMMDLYNSSFEGMIDALNPKNLHNQEVMVEYDN